MADTQIVGDAGDRQAPASHVANPANGSRQNGGITHGSNGAANGHSNGADDRYPTELVDWIYWNESPYWTQFLNGNGASNGHQNGSPQGSEGRPARGMAMEGMTPTGLARRLGR